VRSSFSTLWFVRLSPAAAARVVALVVNAQLGDWRPIERRSGVFVIRYGAPPSAVGRICPSTCGLAAVAQQLSLRLSRPIYQRIRTDGTFRTNLLVASAQALLDADLPLAQGLLRRLIDATCGFEALAQLMDAHPKSLIRMLGPRGNPSARHLASILARAASANGVRLRAASAPSPARASTAPPPH
jgi:hypothetical protein